MIDRNMDNEDNDSEAVLEGSELDKYLKEVSFDGLFETFGTVKEKSQINDIPIVAEENKRFMTKEYAERSNLLLYSKLMLEEDAAFLHSFISNFNINLDQYRSKHIVLFGSVLLTLSSSLTVMFRNIKGFIPVLMGATSFGCLYLRKNYTYQKRKLALVKLLSNFNRIFYFTKKTFKRIREATSCMMTNEVENSLKKNEDPIALCYYKRMEEEINMLTLNLTTVMVEVICLIKKSTLDLKRMMPLYISCSTQFIASLSDDQLGLSKYDTENSSSRNRDSLYTLKNVYVLMQSEYLKAIGICLSPLVLKENLWLDPPLFTILQNNIKCSSTILNKIEYNYRCLVHPKKFTKQTHVLNSFFLDGCNKIQLFTSMLCALLKESDNLEIFMEQQVDEHSDSLIVIDDVILNLQQIEHKLTDCSIFLKDILHFFQHKKGTKNVVNDKDSQKLWNEEASERCRIKQTGVHVGISDFGIHDVDNVYFCITDKSDESGIDCAGDDFDESPPKLPYYVLNELKDALVTKKIEFCKRELEAAKRNNIDSAQLEKLINPEDLKRNKVKKYNYDDQDNHFESINIASDKSSVGNSDIGMLSFQKQLAMRAVNTSLKWNNCSEIVYNDGSSDESSDDSDS